jgi:hypothetical protein
MGYDMSIVGEPDTTAEQERLQQQWNDLIKLRDAAIARLTPAEEKDRNALFRANMLGEPTPDVTMTPTLTEVMNLQGQIEESSEKRNDLRGYYRLNIWGMGICRELMAARGMLLDSDSPFYRKAGAVDDEENERVAEDDYEAMDEVRSQLLEAWGDEAATSAIAAQARPDLYKAAVHSLLQLRESGTPDGTPLTGIPVHKFCSNDGWWVTPEECVAALKSHADYVAANNAGPPTNDQGQTIEWWETWLAFLERASKAKGFQVY